MHNNIALIFGQPPLQGNYKLSQTDTITACFFLESVTFLCPELFPLVATILHKFIELSVRYEVLGSLKLWNSTGINTGVT